MAIKRFTANKDNTITTAFKSGLSQTGKLSNMGASDVLEVYSVYGQATTSSIEKTRVLVQFPVDQILASRNSNDLPASSSVSFKLNLFDVKHGNTVPRNFSISVAPLLESWREGLGLDMEEYTDLDTCNWSYREPSTSWALEGGSIPVKEEMNDTSIPSEFSQSFETGLENLSVDVTSLVEEWIKSEQSSYFSAASGSVKLSSVPVTGSTLTFRSANGDYRIVQAATSSGSSGKTHFLDVSSNNVSTVVTKLKGLFDSSGFNTIFSGAIDGSDPLKVNITQKHKGYYGNTKITKTMASTVVDFAGGSGINNNGFLVKLSGSFEDGTLQKSYFTKKFSARESEYYFQRPIIEAQWDSRVTDDRGRLVTADPKLTNAQNTNNLYYHNYVNGSLTDLPSVPRFILTTDPGLSETVTLLPSTDQNQLSLDISDPRRNAFVEIEFSDESFFSDNYNDVSDMLTWSAAGWIIFTHTNPNTSKEEKFYFFGLPQDVRVDNLNTFNFHQRVIDNVPTAFPIFIAGQAGSIANLKNKTAKKLSEILNNHPGFSSVFKAVWRQGKVRVYTKVAGDAGQNSKCTIFRSAKRSNGEVDVESFAIKYSSTFNESNEFDTKTTKDGSTDSPTISDATTFLRSTVDAAREASGDNRWGFRGSSSDLNFDNDKDAPNDLDLQVLDRSFRGNATPGPVGEVITTTKEATGIYKASFKIANNIQQETLYEKWWITSGPGGSTLDEFSTGIIRGHDGDSPVTVKHYKDVHYGKRSNTDKLVSIANLSPKYKVGEKVELNVLVKNKLSNPNVYSKVMGSTSPDYFDNIYYEIRRVTDDLVIVPFSTGSAVNFSGLGYDESGCNFLLDTGYLEKRYLYEISFCCVQGQQKSILNEKFRFRVE